ncbi:anti-anti-sigma factor [Lentzea flaviverrucosa]|uniref:Anti-sigma factor antagonist n=1 Tax=Lentzea flaviverrucosa TaxID=200379 RepID=A0A1H9RVC6_9PSEU|nr:anti-anti-sigma factor [Lentzea flaviverrucosa]SER76103.1 anti-anti-sigma factor [Lentzea flaviverrucosa]
MRFGHRGVLVNEEQFKESPLLTVRAAEVAGLVVIAVEGEIDVDTADDVLDAVRLGFVSAGPALIADLTLVSFFGSTGISTLISAHELAEENGKKLHIVAPQRAVRRPLQVTGVADVLSLYDSVEEAVSALKPVPSE